MQYKVIIFGAGDGATVIETILKKDITEVVGYLDNNDEKISQLRNGKSILLPERINECEFDYVIVSTVDEGEANYQLRSYGVEQNKIIEVFHGSLVNDPRCDILFCTKWECHVINQYYRVRLLRMEKRYERTIRNIPYEIVASIDEAKQMIPKVESAERLVERILDEGCSLCRFGDYEFEIMMGRKRSTYQQLDEELAKRLKEIIKEDDEKVIIAIADNYGSLEKYTSQSAEAIREYLTTEVREDHIKMLDLNKTYYDAYVSRPYILYRDKTKSSDRFHKIRSIWKNREIVIIEGNKTRMGLGNDLFDNAKSIRRIIGPSENAYSRYEDIFCEAMKLPRDILFLIALGATATVLAYDLSKAGYQALDIGHIDIEYEWFLRGVAERIPIPNKYVNEVFDGCKVPCIEEQESIDIIAYIE